MLNPLNVKCREEQDAISTTIVNAIINNGDKNGRRHVTNMHDQQIDVEDIYDVDDDDRPQAENVNENRR